MPRNKPIAHDTLAAPRLPASAGLNQRLHRLWPTNETFTGEIERSLINVGMAGQTPGGVRYFARLHGVKDPPTVRQEEELR